MRNIMKNMKINRTRKIALIGALIMASFASLWLSLSKDRTVLADGKKEDKEIIVIFNDEVEKDELSDFVLSLGKDVKIKSHLDDYVLLSIKEETRFKTILKRIKRNPEVIVAEENTEINTLEAVNGIVHSFTNTVMSETTGPIDVDMGLKEAWDQLDGKNNREVVVAIIDTGVDYKHPDLTDHIWTNQGEIPDDNLDNDNNGYIDDYYGWDFYNNDSTTCHYDSINKALLEDNDDHGTHIAGIIGAKVDNIAGVAGIASPIDVKIMTLKISGGSEGTGDLSSAIEAIKYATMMGADVCNLSWGTNSKIETLEQVIKESDMLFVAAAGNSGTNNNNTPVYPANFDLPNLISVTFVKSNGELHKLSNYGLGSVDIAAPGEEIFSTTVGSYATMSGSSMAAPHVTGVAALLYSLDDNLYPLNIKEIILNNIKPLPTLNGFITNAGIPSANMAVNASSNLESDKELPELEMETIYNKNEFLIPIKAKDLGGSGIRVIKWIIGDRTLEEFHRGVSGTSVVNKQITITKAGTYTFYASDYAGNEIIKTYDIKDDTTAPKISATYTVAEDFKSRTITVKVSDSLSGIKRVKYKAGEIKSKDFLPADAGTELKLKNGKASFKIKKDGIYTIFASDNRGNLSVKQVEVKTIKVKEISLVTNKKAMKTGQTYSLKAFPSPMPNTDQITFSSSNKKVAKVSDTGRITAISKGKTKITVKATGGAKTVCEITVK